MSTISGAFNGGRFQGSFCQRVFYLWLSKPQYLHDPPKADLTNISICIFWMSFAGHRVSELEMLSSAWAAMVPQLSLCFPSISDIDLFITFS